MAAAHAAGMDAAWEPVDDPAPDPEQAPTYVCGAMDEVAELLGD